MTKHKLTQKQEFWLAHVKQAEASDGSLSAYAKQHQLNLKLFYNMRAILRQKGILPQLPVVNTFVPVSIELPQPALEPCRICLTNGVGFV